LRFDNHLIFDGSLKDVYKARELVTAIPWQQRIGWLLPVAWVTVSQPVQQRAKDISVFSGEGYVGDRQVVIGRYHTDDLAILLGDQDIAAPAQLGDIGQRQCITIWSQPQICKDSRLRLGC